MPTTTAGAFDYYATTLANLTNPPPIDYVPIQMPMPSSSMNTMSKVDSTRFITAVLVNSELFHLLNAEEKILILNIYHIHVLNFISDWFHKKLQVTDKRPKTIQHFIANTLSSKNHLFSGWKCTLILVPTGIQYIQKSNAVIQIFFQVIIFALFGMRSLLNCLRLNFLQLLKLRHSIKYVYCRFEREIH